MQIPYASASAGEAAIADTRDMLYRLGASSFGIMERRDESGDMMLVQFEHRARAVTIKIALQGYAKWWLRENPWTPRRRASEAAWKQKAIEAARGAAPSILRDYVKASITMVEAGAMTFDQAFLGALHLPTGETIYEALEGGQGVPALPSPDDF